MSRRSLGTLSIDVVAEIGGFAAGLDKSERQTEKWRKKVEKEAKLAGASLAAGLATGLAGLSAVGLLIARNSMAAEREVAQLDAIIRSTGGAAGYTRQQLLDMADVLSSKSTFSGGEIVEAQTRLLSYSGILGTNIPRAMQTIIDQSARLGISVSQSAETIGRALESPGKAAAALAQQGFGAAFTKEVRGTIDELVKAGKEGEAQVMILEILEESYGGAAQAARDTFSGALKALRNTLDDVTTGKDGSLVGATAAVNSFIDTLNDPQVKAGFDAMIVGLGAILSDFSVYLKDGAEVRSLTESIADSFRQISDLGGIFSGAIDGLDRVRGGLVAIEKQGNAVMKLATGQYSGLFGSQGGGWDQFTKDYQAGTDFADKGWKAMQGKAIPPRVILVEPDMTDRGVTGDPAARAAAAAAARSATTDAEAAKKRLAGQQQLKQALESTTLQYLRQIEMFDSSADKSAKATELQQLNFDLARGSLKGLNAADQERLRTLAKTLDGLAALKTSNEQAAKSAEFARNAQAALSNARASLAVDLVGAGDGEQARSRARALLQIEADYQKQRAALFEQYQAGDLTEAIYKAETDVLQSALDERLRMQQDHYRKLDELRGDWQVGMADAWADYATKAVDANQHAYDAVTGFLDTTTGDVAESIADLVKGNESLTDSVKNLVVSMGETVIDTLSRMAAQWLVYQATQKLVGEATSQSSTAALTGNAVAMSAQAAIAAYASTAAIPITGPIAAPAAAAAALAATAPYVAAVAASSGLSGMAHDGIDAVPETGTWLLQKGERVTTAATSAKLDATLERVSRDSSPAANGDNFNLSFEVNGSTSERERQMLEATVKRAVVQAKKEINSDMARGTGISKTMRTTHNVGIRVR